MFDILHVLFNHQSPDITILELIKRKRSYSTLSSSTSRSRLSRRFSEAKNRAIGTVNKTKRLTKAIQIDEATTRCTVADIFEDAA